MHVHSVRTTLDKVEGELGKLLPPDGTRFRHGHAETYSDDLIDLKVEFLGGRDVLAIAVHEDHDVEPTVVVSDGLVRVEHYGPDHRYFETEGGAAMPPDSAGLVEDVRRTWALWFGQDGRPTSLWLFRDASGAVLGNPIQLSTAGIPFEQGVDPVARTVTIRRKDNGWDQFAFVDDDGQQVACFTVDPRHVTLVHDRPVPPEWIGHGLPETSPPLADGFALDCRDGLIGWMEAHPEFVGEGSALDNVLRLLDHAYEENGCSDPRFLSAKTPTLHRAE